MRDQFLKNYTLTSSMTLLFLRLKSHLPQIPHLEFNVHSYRPGDYILIRTCKKERLQPTWEGSYHVLLTTKTAVCTAEKVWTHYTRVKSLPKNYWTTITDPGNPLKVVLRWHEPTLLWVLLLLLLPIKTIIELWTAVSLVINITANINTQTIEFDASHRIYCGWLIRERLLLVSWT
jgi:hypothetical protein